MPVERNNREDNITQELTKLLWATIPDWQRLSSQRAKDSSFIYECKESVRRLETQQSCQKERCPELTFSDDVPVRPQPALITNGPSGTLGMCG